VYEFKRLTGLSFLAFAFFCSLHVSDHLRSPDPYFRAVGRVDAGITVSLIVAGLYLLLSPTRAPRTMPRREQKPAVLAFVGLVLIALSLLTSSSLILISLSGATTRGTVLSSVPGRSFVSGKTIYSITYRYRDSSGETHVGKDAVYSVGPIASTDPIDIAYSSMKPALSKIASRINFLWGWGLGLGLLYEFWAVRGTMRRRRLARTANSRPMLQPLEEVVVSAGIIGPFLGLMMALAVVWVIHSAFSQHHLDVINWERLAFFAAMALFGICWIVLSLSIRLMLSDQGIHSRRLFQKDKFMAWSQITTIRWGKYRNRGKGFIVSTPAGVELHIPAYYTNLEGLVGAITRHLPPSAYADAEAGFTHAHRMARLGRRQFATPKKTS
jgi:hypothetical protein